jgi:hypothetical protein
MLEYYITKVGEGAFIFRITEQDEKLTSFIKSRHNKCFYANNGWKVVVDEEPEVNVDRKTIYLRGADKYQDGKIDRHWDLREKEVKEVIKSVDKALEDAVASAKAWKPLKTFQVEKVVLVDAYAYDPYYSFRKNPSVVIINR